MNNQSIYSYLKEYKVETVLAPTFKMLEALLELFVPLVVASIIDKGIWGHQPAHILAMCLLMLALAAIGLTCSITAQYFSAKAAVGACTRMRQAIFDHIMGLDYTAMDWVGPSTLLTRLTSDVNQVQNGINLTLRLFLRSPFIVFGAMIMAFTIDPRLSLIFVGAIIALFIVVFGVMALTRPLYRRVQNELDTILSITRENLIGVRVIRAFHQEEEERETFTRENAALTSLQKLSGRISGLTNPLTFVIINFAIIWLIYQGGLQVQTKVLSLGQVVALYNYMSQILVELIKLANLIVTMTRAMACYTRIQDIFKEEARVVDRVDLVEGKGRLTEEADRAQGQDSMTGETDWTQGQDSMTGEVDRTLVRDGLACIEAVEGEEAVSPKDISAVEFHNVSFRYEGAGDLALSNVSFRAMKGETIGIIGGTGSGKSTLVNLIPRFYDVEEGEVLINGIPVKDMPAAERMEEVAVVPQKAQLFSGTVRENLMLGVKQGTKERQEPNALIKSSELKDSEKEGMKIIPNEQIEERLQRALDVSQAREFVDRMPGGLDARIVQGGKNLSGGQRQRLTIARALVKEAPILILDDSASALDYATDKKLRLALRELPFSPTVFIVSQRTSSIMQADRILVLDNGELVGTGTHEELLAGCQVYREIQESQGT